MDKANESKDVDGSVRPQKCGWSKTQIIINQDPELHVDSNRAKTMKTNNVVEQGFCGINVSLNIFDVKALQEVMQICNTENEKCLIRKEWEETKWKLEGEARKAYEEQVPRPQNGWYDVSKDEIFDKFVIFFNKIIKDLPPVMSENGIFEEKKEEVPCKEFLV